MDQEKKNKLLNGARAHIRIVRAAIKEKAEATQQLIAEITGKLHSLAPEPKMTQMNIMHRAEVRVGELSQMQGSPYFIKCEIRFDGEGVSRIFYFSKFNFTDENIYSWTAPAAQLRFESPGKFSYQVPNSDQMNGTLLSKEQYMITDGKIVFMATESTTHERELVYQEFLTQHKSSFALPEIVEQMEKSQDQVIRAHPEGSFLVSGPAGSGKTTLALHRVAYLLQSPDFNNIFTAENSIVFVQDSSTREYFNQLLPQLGINDVQITTFVDWIREKLQLYGLKYVVRYGQTEFERDQYEYQKYQAIKEVKQIQYQSNAYATLRPIYEKFLTDDLLALFASQQKDRMLDRFDYTLLAMAYLKSNAGFTTEELTLKQLKGGRIQRTKSYVPLRYNLMIMDEVQNYLPEQIAILKSCLNPSTNALVYVGDLAQQTQLCTLRDWDQVQENFGNERKVTLLKNYRSTKQIMQFIKDVGFNVDAPDSLREGKKVVEIKTASIDEQLDYLKKVVTQNPEVVIGVMAKIPEYLLSFNVEFKNNKRVHVLTINEAQGVEFDIACLVGMDTNLFDLSDYRDELFSEKQRVNKDLIYVGLTRAMNELYVLGDTSLKDLLH